MKLFEVTEEEKFKDSPPLKFFHKIVAENLIPDRSAESLKTAYKKFCQMTRGKFVKAAMSKKTNRFSHMFEKVPEVSMEEAKETTTTTKFNKNLNKIFNSASTKPQEQEELSSESVMGVDLEVMTKEPTICEGDDIEFVLEIEDMQSVISNYVTGDSSYNLRPVRKRRHVSSLDKMYSSYAKAKGSKRVKITEVDEQAVEYNESDSTIYEQEDLLAFLKNSAKVKISNNLANNTRSYSSDLPKKNHDEALFKNIMQELETLSQKYNYTIDEIHTLWMESCCDIDELKKVLSGEKMKIWSNLEDYAICSEPGSMEYQ